MMVKLILTLLIHFFFVCFSSTNEDDIKQLYMSVQYDVSFSVFNNDYTVAKLSFNTKIKCTRMCLHIPNCQVVNYGYIDRTCRIYNSTAGSFDSVSGFIIYVVKNDTTVTNLATEVTTITDASITTIENTNIAAITSASVTTIKNTGIGTVTKASVTTIENTSTGTVTNAGVTTTESTSIDIVTNGSITTVQSTNIDTITNGSITTVQSTNIGAMTSASINTEEVTSDSGTSEYPKSIYYCILA